VPRTAYGQHADYVFGWKGDALQKAMDGGCFGSKCAGLNVQDFATANKCGVQQLVKENVEGCELPFTPPLPFLFLRRRHGQRS